MKITPLLILIINAVLTSSISWLSLYRGGSEKWSHSRACRVARRVHGFSKSQTRTCRKQVEVMPHVTHAARNAIYTCQKIFQKSRWNCSSILNAPDHTPDLTEGTREQAITHAIASASVAWSVSRACAQGTLMLCGCGTVPQEPPNGPFQWGGCGDNIIYGSKFARDFVDATDVPKASKKRQAKILRQRRWSPNDVEYQLEDDLDSDEDDDDQEDLNEEEGKKIDKSKKEDGLEELDNTTSLGLISNESSNHVLQELDEEDEDDRTTRHHREVQPFSVSRDEDSKNSLKKNTRRTRSKKNKKKKKKRKKKPKRRKGSKKEKKQNPVIIMMNHHNNRVGRRVVESSLSTQCKCHGVSGSCNIKTCWKALPNFLQVGERLHRSYRSGVEVKEVSAGPRLRLLPASPAVRRFSRDDLIYVTKSPDYCHPQQKVGSLGTRGRHCNVTSRGVDGCEMMCCGRGHISEAIMYHQRCHCKYHWCCYVKCQTCAVWEDVHTCN